MKPRPSPTRIMHSAGGTFTMGGFLAHFIRPYTVVVGQILLPSVPATLARRVGS